MKQMIIVDDNEDIVNLLSNFFAKNQFEITTASSGKEAVKIIKNRSFDIAICDFKLPDYKGVELLQKLKILDSTLPVIIIAGYNDVRTAVDALKKGASDYVTKPLYPDEMLHTVKSALANASNRKEKKAKPAKIPKKEFVYGVSPGAKKVQEHVKLIAPTNMSVIITGESGTGKEYIARQIHDKSRRSDEPFVAIDCGALSEELAASELFGHVKGAFTGATTDKQGSFEVADQGTLFLDEIGNLSMENQIKLLRAIQEHKIKRVGSNKEAKVNVRIIVATNEDLKTAIGQQVFREDLFHRLNEFNIQLHPLRRRKEDIMIFAQYFLQRSNLELFKSVKSFSKSAEQSLINYQWPGNLRELKNVIKRAVLLCQGESITTQELREEITDPDYFASLSSNETNSEIKLTDLKSVVMHAEKEAIERVLIQTGFNKSKTAEILEIDRKTLYNKMNAYHIAKDGL